MISEGGKITKDVRDCKLQPVKTNLRIIRHLPASPPLQPSALTIGNLDGVHLGHQAMLACVCDAAQQLSLSPSVLTFHPHPRHYFATRHAKPELSPRQINSLRDKIGAIASAGIEQIALLPFNQQLASMTAEAFIERLLLEQLNAKWLMVGPDFRFGKDRAGNVTLLQSAGKSLGFEVRVIHQVSDHAGERISSSMVRAALADGDMLRVQRLLGRPWRLTGHVIHGKKLGRTLGFPTLNMRMSTNTAVRFGIYVVRILGLGPKPLPGIASLGIRPTVDDELGVLLETHIIGADVNAYGKLLAVELLQHVRDEHKFPDLNALTAAMQRDREQALEYFAHHGLQNNAESD